MSIGRKQSWSRTKKVCHGQTWLGLLSFCHVLVFGNSFKHSNISVSVIVLFPTIILAVWFHQIWKRTYRGIIFSELTIVCKILQVNYLKLCGDFSLASPSNDLKFCMQVDYQ